MIRLFRTLTCAAMLPAAALCFSPVAMLAQSAHSARAGNDVIAGTVISGATGDPLAQADIHLTEVTSGADMGETITGNDGRFVFPHLPDGRYDLRASHRGYVTSGYDEHDQMMDTAIVTGPDLVTSGIRLTLPPNAAIYGKVTEDSGDLVPRARITLYAPDLQDGSGKMKRARSVQADEMGNFDAGNLSPGKYYLCASGTPWYAQPSGGAGNAWATSPLNMAYPIACYPDGAEPAGAAAIAVNGGDRAHVDLVLHPVQAVQVTLQVPHPDPRRGMVMPQLQQEVFGIPENIASASMFTPLGDRQVSSSIAEVREYGIPPGQYQVLLDANSSTGNTARAGSIDVSSGEANLDISSLPALPGISGTVQMADGGGIPSGLAAALVSQQNADSIGYAQVAADGSFHLDGLRPGKYELTFRGSGTPFAVAAMSATGAVSHGRMLEMGNSAATVLAVVARVKASIYGKVESAGKPAPGVFVLLVPTDSGAGREAWIPNQTDSDGSFLYPYVPPGNYKLVAITQGWALDWAQPQAIARYMAKGVDVTVGAASTRIELKQPLQAQAK